MRPRSRFSGLGAYFSRLLGRIPQFRNVTPSRAFAWLIVAVMLFTLVGGERGLLRLMIILHDRSNLASEIVRLERRAGELEYDLKCYTGDPFTIERTIREELDWGRRGEVVYKFPSRQE